MFDFHMHSRVSFDGKSSAREMAQAAAARGLQAICFTDHKDYDPRGKMRNIAFQEREYRLEYDNLKVADLEICRGMEFGLLADNREMLQRESKAYPYDFVIGSVHFVDGLDPYFPEFWENVTYETGELRYFEEILRCVQVHDGYDVLGHITFLSKARANPRKERIPLERHRELMDEVFRILAERGIGIEMNTSGMDRCGSFLPDPDYLRRFCELGGRIVTVGSDAHDADRVGQYCREACEIVQDIFGYVCTFKNRKPVFHRV